MGTHTTKEYRYVAYNSNTKKMVDKVIQYG